MLSTLIQLTLVHANSRLLPLSFQSSFLLVGRISGFRRVFRRYLNFSIAKYPTTRNRKGSYQENEQVQLGHDHGARSNSRTIFINCPAVSYRVVLLKRSFLSLGVFTNTKVVFEEMRPIKVTVEIAQHTVTISLCKSLL